jgi:ABC-type branched-subunit amino acid transport system substrate-binding protein
MAAKSGMAMLLANREDPMKAFCILAAAWLAATTALPARAADAIKIGVIYPLTGNAASAGSSAKDAVELGAEIVNTGHPDRVGLRRRLHAIPQ